MEPRLCIRLSGHFHVHLEGQKPVTEFADLWSHRKAQQVLALLALFPNQRLDKGEVAVQLWGGGASEENLKKAVQALRDGLGPAHRERVVSVQGCLYLDAGDEEVAIDVASLSVAWESRTESPASVVDLVDAVAACKYTLLQGWDEPWVKPLREDFQGKVRAALGFLAAHYTAAGDFAAAQRHLARLRQACGDCAEALHVDLMQACLDRVAHSTASQFYREYAGFLRERHGLAPPPAMTEMYERLPRFASRFDPPVDAVEAKTEFPGGAVALDSDVYVERDADRHFHVALERREGMILVNGPRQVGKSSLLLRGMGQAKGHGWRVLSTDFQRFDAASLESLPALYRTVMRAFHRELSLARRPDEYWDEAATPNENLEGYLEDVVLPESTVPLLWCIDEADRLFDCGFRSDVFGLFRSWYNKRRNAAILGAGVWSRLQMVLTYSTEAYLFIPDTDQSPFNVGEKVTLADFSAAEVKSLIRQYNRHNEAFSGLTPTTEEDGDCLMDLVGGHPYLVRLCLYEMKRRGWSPANLNAEADQDFGLFRDHLARLHAAIKSDPELAGGVRTVLHSPGERLPQTTFVRLRAAGVIRGTSASSAELRCDLYRRYFTRHLI